jgi:hypothetical protein
MASGVLKVKFGAPEVIPLHAVKKEAAPLIPAVGAVCPAVPVRMQPVPVIVALALVDIPRSIRADTPIPTKRLFHVIFVLLNWVRFL